MPGIHVDFHTLKEVQQFLRDHEKSLIHSNVLGNELNRTRAYLSHVDTLLMGGDPALIAQIRPGLIQHTKRLQSFLDRTKASFSYIDKLLEQIKRGEATEPVSLPPFVTDPDKWWTALTLLRSFAIDNINDINAKIRALTDHIDSVNKFHPDFKEKKARAPRAVDSDGTPLYF